MEAICRYLRSQIGEIAVEWTVLTIERPWLALSQHRRFDMAPELVLGLVEASVCTPVSREAHRTKVYLAAEHGALRREREFDIGILFIEYFLLREAFWRVLKRASDLPAREMMEGILRIDSAFNLVTRASMAGYHRSDYEARHLWPAVLEELLEESPLPRLESLPR